MSDEIRISDEVVVRAYRPGDEQSILDCFNQVFADPADPSTHRVRSHWDWKFAENPAGRVHHSLAVHSEHGVVGMYAGLPIRMLSEGEPLIGSQAVDLMVLPEWRRHGARPGLFVQIGRHFHDHYFGRGEDKSPFYYGWPMGNWRVGKKYLLYENIRDWDLTFLELGPDTPPRSAPAELETKRVERYDADVDELFASLVPQMPFVTIRDSAYLNWRYADHTDHSYKLYECREKSTGALRGIAIYTVGDFMRPNTGFIVDWLNEGNDVDTMNSMLAVMEQQAVVDQVGLIASVWNTGDIRCLHLQHAGYKIKGTPYFLTISNFACDAKFIRENWYLTMGDSDLI